MKKGIGEKVLGWFIVQDDDESAASAAARGSDAEEAETQRARRNAADDGDGNEDARAEGRSRPRDVSRSGGVPRPVVAPGASHDDEAFGEVYRVAGLPGADAERLTKVLELLASLPEATHDVKRSIVAAALQAFAVPIDRIVMTADAAVAALDGYVTEGERRTEDVLAEGRARIARLASEIEEVRRLMEVQIGAQEELARAAASEKARVRAALDFFAPSPALGAALGRASGADGAAPAPRLVRLK